MVFRVGPILNVVHSGEDNDLIFGLASNLLHLVYYKLLAIHTRLVLPGRSDWLSWLADKTANLW